MLKKLRVKFVVINMGIAAVLIAVILSLVIGFTRSALEADSVQALLSAASARPSDRQSFSFPYFCLEQGQRGEGVTVWGNYYDHYTPAQLVQIAEEAVRTGQTSGVLAEYGLRFCRSSGPRGEIWAFRDISGEQTAVKSLVRSCVFIGVFALGIFLLVSITLAYWAVKPVEQAWQQQRQFVADASHELKTPLTVILTNAELLAEADSPEEQANFRGNILTMARQMRHLVERLLELARADNGSLRTAFSPVDLSALVEESLLPFEPLYFEQGLELGWEVQKGLWVNGSPGHLTQVAEILLDNAMKYSSPGSRVRAELKAQGSHVLLSVRSPGEAIPGEDLENIFKRFYRMDKARSRDGSYGLGLSIAQSIITEHGGRIWAESAPGVNTFHVRLPRQSAPPM